MQAAMTAATPPTSQQRSLYNMNGNHGICLLFSGMVLHVHVGSNQSPAHKSQLHFCNGTCLLDAGVAILA